MKTRFSVPGELDNLYKSMRGEGLNAHTTHQKTVYRVGLQANRLKQGAVIESGWFQRPILRLFQTQLEIISEKKPAAR